jgi:hypothetical protein
MSIKYPEHYANTIGNITHFGFVYNPFFRILHGNIAILRSLNLLFALVLNFTLAFLVLKYLKNEISLRLSLIPTALVIATTSYLNTVFNGQWLPSPSYNTLNFQGLLLMSCGIALYMGKKSELQNYVAIYVIAFGSSICFLGKPSSALVGFGMSALVILVKESKNRKTKWLRLLGFCLMSASMTSLMLIFYHNTLKSASGAIRTGLEAMKMLQGSRTFTVSSEINKWSPEENLLYVFLCGFVIGMMLQHICEKGIRSTLEGSKLAFAICFQVLLIIVFYFLKDRIVLLYGMIFGGFIWIVVFGKAVKVGTHYILSVTFLLLAPFVYAFGSSNNYWISMQSAVSIAIVGSLFFLKLIGNQRLTRTLLLYGLLSVQVALIITLVNSVQAPYRQSPQAFGATTKFQIESKGNSLYLPGEVTQVLSKLKDKASSNGFRSGSYVIDSTGRLPGIIFLLGGVSLGAPWQLGGYVGSSSYFLQSIQREPCLNLASAWILREPEGELAIPMETLNILGIDLTSNYELIEKFDYPIKLGATTQKQSIEIYRPIQTSTRDIFCKKNS